MMMDYDRNCMSKSRLARYLSLFLPLGRHIIAIFAAPCMCIEFV